MFSKFSALAKLATPIIATALVFEVSNLTTLYFVGRINGAKFIGAATLGAMMCNITGYSLMYGMCSALDTLLSQAFGGKSYHLAGLYLQRSMVIFSLASLPIVAIWSKSDLILRFLLGIDAETAALACTYAKILSVGLWPSLLNEAAKRWLQSQNIVWPAVVSTLFGSILNLCLNVYWQLIMSPSLGFEGVAVAVALMQWFTMLVLFGIIGLIYRFNSSYLLSPQPNDRLPVGLAEEKLMENILPAFSLEIFNDWSVFLALGIPGAISLFVEWGSFEFAAGIAGQLGTIPLAVHGIFSASAGLFYLVPQAVASSVSVLVGNYLGARLFLDAAAVVKLGLVIGFIYGSFAGSLLVYHRETWSTLFTSDSAVQEVVFRTLPVMFIYIVVDSSKCISLNVLRSTGRPGITVGVNSFVCLVIMLPVGWLLAVDLGYGLTGLWLAMSLAWLLATIFYGIIMWRTDWSDAKLLLINAD